MVCHLWNNVAGKLNLSHKLICELVLLFQCTRIFLSDFIDFLFREYHLWVLSVQRPKDKEGKHKEPKDSEEDGDEEGPEDDEDDEGDGMNTSLDADHLPLSKYR